MRRIGGSTLARQADKRPARRVQFGHPSLDGSDTRVGELTRPDAVGRCVEFEQFVDFGECETRGLCRFDEAQTRVDGFVIAANSAPHAAIFTLPGNGKKASEAQAEPFRSRPKSAARRAAIRAESLRFIWPAPTPRVWPPRA